MGVFATHDLPPELVARQIDVVVEDLGVDALKSGMLSNAGIVEAVADRVLHYQLDNYVLDPVMVSESGHALLEEDAVAFSPFEKRRVWLVDGTSVSAPDTPENQAVYPQHANQAKGCGFPMIKLTALFSLSTGAVHTATAGDLQTSEIGLFRDQAHHIKPEDLIVADRLYGSYADLCMVQKRGADALFRLHQARQVNWRTGERLGPYDRLYQWKKPITRPKGLDPKTYAELPDTLVVRILRYIIAQDGFRTRIVTLVTTLTDPERYPAEAIATLYAKRWQVEIDFRHLKSTMNMDMLSCKSPQMLLKELAVYFLTYNLICALRQKAARLYYRPTLHLSFKGTKTHLETFMPILAYAKQTAVDPLINLVLWMTATVKWIQRPGRLEPRLRKKRPKPMGYLKEPRAVIKEKLRLEYTLVQ